MNPTADLLARLAEEASATTLPRVLAAADLQTRVDRKYLLDADQLTALAPVLAGLDVLEIDGRRLFGYESVYFDTRTLDLYRAHHQGKRRRWKARTRTYLDTGACLFEVKTQGRRETTVKARMPYDTARRGCLDRRAQDFLADTLRREYATEAPHLVPAVTTHYRRSTFVDIAGGSRVTCDVDLRFVGDGREVTGPDRVLVETKSLAGSPVDGALSRLGIRPVSMSKYCLGTALLHPSLPASRWHQLLTHEFGRRRPRAVPASGPAQISVRSR